MITPFILKHRRFSSAFSCLKALIIHIIIPARIDVYKYALRYCFLILPFFFNLLQAGCCSFHCLPWLQDDQPPGWYASAFGGMNGGYDIDCKDVHTNRGYYLGMNGGKKVFPNVRLEGDFIWQRNGVGEIEHGTLQKGKKDLDHPKGNFSIASLMANAILDLNFPFPGSPSIGGGVGYADAHGDWSGDLTKTINGVECIKKIKSSYKTQGFAWQVIANLNFFICHQLKINVEYRYFNLGRPIRNHKFGLSLSKFF